MHFIFIKIHFIAKCFNNFQLLQKGYYCKALYTLFCCLHCTKNTQCSNVQSVSEMPERHCGWRCLIASWVSYTDSSLTAVADDTTANKSHFSKLQTHKLVFKVGWVFSKNFRPGGVYQKYPQPCSRSLLYRMNNIC